jgi:predicted RNA-binding Zn-ribbon protein involved in translation (DUF1610 family)
MPEDAIDVEAKPLAVARPTSIAEWTPNFAVAVDEAIERKAQKKRFFESVMDADLHYGVIPGTKGKPTLLKPGAEMLLANMGLASELSDAEAPTRDYGEEGQHPREGMIVYRRVCRIFKQTGPREDERMLVAQAEGSCSSREAKYRWRETKRVCPTCGNATIIKGKAEYGGGWICWKKPGKSDGCGAKFDQGDTAIVNQTEGKTPNPNLADVENTILKMADKRALVAATLLATGCSDIFTQDVEDNAPEGKDEPVGVPPHEPPPEIQPSVAEKRAALKAELEDLAGRLVGAEVEEVVKKATQGRASTLDDIKTAGDAKQVRDALRIFVQEAANELPL